MHLSIRQTFFIILFIGLFAMTLRPVADPDFWWHLRTGQLIAETGAIPRSDPFSFTLPGKAWIAHEWLAELSLHAIYLTGGFELLTLVFSLIITAAFLLTYLACRNETRPYAAGFAVLLAALASAPTWGVRPQMFSLLLTAVFLLLLHRYKETRKLKYVAFLPFVTILWVNLHAGYLLGLAVIGIYLTGEAIKIAGPLLRREKTDSRPIIVLAATLMLCLLSALANPNTYHILTYPFETLSSNSMMQFIQEWFSPDFHRPEWIPLVVLLVVLFALPLLARRPVPLTRVLLAVVFGFAALRSMRHVPLFALTTIPLLAEQLAGLSIRKQTAESHLRLTSWLNLFLVLDVLLATGLRFLSVTQEQPVSELEQYPKSAVDWIQENDPEGNIYNTYGWGGYLIWRLYPDRPVYIDGRADVYGDEFIYDYLGIYDGQPGWQDLLDEADVGVALVEPGSGLANVMRSAPGWQVAYEDNQSVIFLRK